MDEKVRASAAIVEAVDGEDVVSGHEGMQAGAGREFLIDDGGSITGIVGGAGVPGGGGGGV